MTTASIRCRSFTESVETHSKKSTSKRQPPARNPMSNSQEMKSRPNYGANKLILPQFTMMALFLFAVVPARNHNAQAFTFTSTLVAPPISLETNNIPVSCTRTSIRRQLIFPLSQSAGDEDDGSFFLNASRQAAQQRMQQLKEGNDPLAISLSSPSLDDSGVGDDPKALFTVNVEGEEVDTDKNPAASTEKGGGTQEVKTPVDPFEKRQEEQKQIASSQSSYKFQKALLESRLLMNKRVKLSKEGNEDLEASGGSEPTVEENEELEASGGSEEVESATAMPETKFEGGSTTTSLEVDETIITVAKPGKDAASQGDKEITDETILDLISAIESTTTERDTDSAKKTLDAKEEDSFSPPESQPTTDSGLSSDGKAIFEPSPSSLKVNPENVDMGLLVLTQSLITLQSILNKKE